MLVVTEDERNKDENHNGNRSKVETITASSF